LPIWPPGLKNLDKTAVKEVGKLLSS